MTAPDILLRGLQVNGQPFFARTRPLTLTATDCTRVVKLSWCVWPTRIDRHFIWLLSRLERCGTIEPPWTWGSHYPDARPVSFRAWLVSPVGYGGDPRGSLTTTVRLHCYLAPDDPAQDTPPVFCPASCNHVSPPWARETQATPPSVREALREARGQQFDDWVIRWFSDKTK